MHTLSLQLPPELPSSINPSIHLFPAVFPVWPCHSKQPVSFTLTSLISTCSQTHMRIRRYLIFTHSGKTQTDAHRPRLWTSTDPTHQMTHVHWDTQSYTFRRSLSPLHTHTRRQTLTQWPDHLSHGNTECSCLSFALLSSLQVNRRKREEGGVVDWEVERIFFFSSSSNKAAVYCRSVLVQDWIFLLYCSKIGGGCVWKGLWFLERSPNIGVNTLKCLLDFNLIVFVSFYIQYACLLRNLNRKCIIVQNLSDSTVL